MAGATCSQIDRAKAWAERNGFTEVPGGGIVQVSTGAVVAHGWNTFYVQYLYDIERDPCA